MNLKDATLSERSRVRKTAVHGQEASTTGAPTGGEHGSVVPGLGGERVLGKAALCGDEDVPELTVEGLPWWSTG